MGEPTTELDAPLDGESIIALDSSLGVMSCNPAAQILLGLELNPGDLLPLGRVCDAASLPYLKEALDTAAAEMHDLLGDCAPLIYPVK